MTNELQNTTDGGPNETGWEDRYVEANLSKRAHRFGAAYAGPGSGRDIPTGERPPIAFTGGLPDPRMHPVAELKEALSEVLAEDADGALQYGGPQGYLELREWMADHWSKIEGIELDADNFMLTNGSAGALVAVCDTFLDDGDVVVAESITFPGSIRAIKATTPNIECVNIDDQGLDVDDLAAVLERLGTAGTPAKMLYIIPNFQNPTGSTLSLERRKRVVELCAKYGTLIVEDEAYAELSFGESTQPPSMYSIANGEGVVKVGTFSKVIDPGLRVGWVQARHKLIAACNATRADMGSSPLAHRLVYKLASSGFLDKHILELRELYERKCETMLDELERSCAGRATWNRPQGGFFIWVTIADDIDPIELAKAAEQEGVSFVGGQVFTAHQNGETGRPFGSWVPGDSKHFRLAFSYAEEDTLREGVRRIGRALERAQSS